MSTTEEVKKLAHLVVEQFKAYKKYLVPVGVSNRHVHLCQEDLERLFGTGFALTPKNFLGQPGQFAAQETVTLQGPKGTLSNVRILGPVRNLSQVEISKTDSFVLGVKAPLRLSGHIKDTPGLTLVGPVGTITLPAGVIVAQRHIHMTPQEAQERHLHNGQLVAVETFGERKAILHDVAIRVAANAAWEMHIDVDEANACSLQNKDAVLILNAN